LADWRNWDVLLCASPNRHEQCTSRPGYFQSSKQQEVMVLSSLEALRRAREEVCSGCGRVLAERWECINPNCLSPRRRVEEEQKSAFDRCCIMGGFGPPG
jgi:hypothetical protein